MAYTDKNQMWEIIDSVIAENVENNESIKTCGDCSIDIAYSKIESNNLMQSRIHLDRKTVAYMTIPTLRIFIKEIINVLRRDAL